MRTICQPRLAHHQCGYQEEGTDRQLQNRRRQVGPRTHPGGTAISVFLMPRFRRAIPTKYLLTLQNNRKQKVLRALQPTHAGLLPSDAIAQWWLKEGCQRYPVVRELFILADGGGKVTARDAAPGRKRIQDTICTPLGLTVTRQPLSPGRFEVESHRAPPVQPNQQKLGWRTPSPTSTRSSSSSVPPKRNPALPSMHIIPRELRHRNQDLRRGNASTHLGSPRNARGVELYRTPLSECELILGHRLSMDRLA